MTMGGMGFIPERLLMMMMMIVSCLVLSLLTYGAAESWALTCSKAAQLEAFQNTCMRHMMGR